MYRDEEEKDLDPVFHERLQIMKDEGYRGFSIHSEHGKASEIEVTATDNSGHVVTASGETKEEAFEKIIDLIDTSLDDVY